MARPNMLTLLLFIYLTQVSCGWVEISQQHYDKPARTTRFYPQKSVIKEFERTTKANRVFVNHSLANPGWNTGAVYKVPNSGVKRLIDSEVIRSKPINFQEDKSELDPRKIFVGPTKPKSEIRKRPTEDNKRFTGHVFYNKDNVRRISFTSTEESLKPLEVLNLSDLDYDDEFPIIEVDDGPLSVDQFEHTKHVTSVILTEEDVDQAVDILNISQSGSKNYAKTSFSTKAPSKIEDIKLTKKSPVTKVPNKNSADQNSPKSSKKESGGNLNSRPINNSNPKNRNKVVVLKDKPSNNANSTGSEKIKEEVPKYKKKNHSSSQSTTQRAQETKNNASSKINDNNKLRDSADSLPQAPPSEKPTQEKLKLKKNVLRIDELPKRSKTRSPEEVMLEEMMQESDETFENDNHRTALEHANTGTVKKVSNKSTITKVYPKIDKSGSKPIVESKDQSTVIKTVAAKEIVSNNQKNGKVANTNSASERPSLTTPIIPTKKGYKRQEETEEFDIVQLNSPKPTPFAGDILKFSGSENDEYEEIPDFDINEEEILDNVQEDKKVFVLTASSGDHEETKPKVKPAFTESTTSSKIELTTKASSMEQIKRTTYENKETEKLDFKTLPKVDKNKQEEDWKQKQEDKTTAEETLANDTTADTLGILVKVLKLVTETISKNTRKTLKGKLRYLEELRDTIMASIEQRLEAAFPDDDAPRRARSAPHPRGHHVEFPSSESALMTISFLTFAVFLIKLVLQLIHAYKYKTMMPAVVATVGRAYHEYSKTKSDDTK